MLNLPPVPALPSRTTKRDGFSRKVSDYGDQSAFFSFDGVAAVRTVGYLMPS